MKCSALLQPLLTGICTSLTKGGSKLGSDMGRDVEAVILDASDADCIRLGRLESYLEFVRSLVEGPALACGFSGAGFSGEDRKRLSIPLTITPGCMPRKGVSKPMIPSIRCRNGSLDALEYGGRRATSAASIPPMLCPRRMTSVSGASCGCSLAKIYQFERVPGKNSSKELTTNQLLKSSVAYSIGLLDLYLG
jgi:hypothetical protein